MIVACPNCSTRYKLPQSEHNAERRNVRCAKCRYEWQQAGPGPKPATVPLDHLITCPQCKAHYQLKQVDLPVEGRDVRCKNCDYEWHHRHSFSPPREASGAAWKLPPTNSQNIPLAAERVCGMLEILNAPAVADRSAERFSTQVVNGPGVSKPASIYFSYRKTLLGILTGVPARAQRFGNGRTRIVTSARCALIGMLIAGLLAIWWVMLTKSNQNFPGQKENDASGKSSIEAPAEPNTSIVPPFNAGIRLRDVTYNLSIAYGLGTMITIRGAIENSAGEELRLPKSVRIILRDANKKTLYKTNFTPNVNKLGPHQTVSFETEIYNAPPETESLELALDKSNEN
jgi:predicted Zn finger-like uncharacterized protein